MAHSAPAIATTLETDHSLRNGSYFWVCYAASLGGRNRTGAPSVAARAVVAPRHAGARRASLRCGSVLGFSGVFAFSRMGFPSRDDAARRRIANARREALSPEPIPLIQSR